MKNVFLTIVSIITMVVMVACGGNTKITVKGANGTEYESYQECCEVQDFGAAHQYLAKMKHEIDVYTEKHSEKLNDWDSEEYQKLRAMEEAYDEACKYVLHREALFLIADGSKDAVNRLFFLIEEDGGDHISASTYIDLAFTQNNTYLATKMLASDNSLSTEKNVQKAIASNMDEIVDIMLGNAPSLIEVPVCAQYYRTRDESLYNKYMQIHQQAIKDQLNIELNRLISKGDFSFISKGIHHDRYKVEKEVDASISKISDFNSECVTLIQKAIKYKSKDIANSALKQMKPNIENFVGRDYPKVDGVHLGYNTSYIRYVENDINDAKKIIQEAERSGAFK